MVHGLVPYVPGEQPGIAKLITPRHFSLLRIEKYLRIGAPAKCKSATEVSELLTFACASVPCLRQLGK